MGLYSHYDRAHNHPANRALHMLAIPVGFSSLIVVWFSPMIGVLLIPAAFALAWLGTPWTVSSNWQALLTLAALRPAARFLLQPLPPG